MKKKKQEVQEVYKYSWEIAFENEIMQMQNLHNYGEITDEEYSDWQKDILRRMCQIRDMVVEFHERR